MSKTPRRKGYTDDDCERHYSDTPEDRERQKHALRYILAVGQRIQRDDPPADNAAQPGKGVQ